jgi:hypothetical protein
LARASGDDEGRLPVIAPVVHIDPGEAEQDLEQGRIGGP